MMHLMGKNEKKVLDFGESARKAIICGLSWDPKDDKSISPDAGAPALRGVNKDTFDLDLTCILFGKNGEYLGAATGAQGANTADNGNVYHTGDDTSGVGEGDDEKIVAELFNLSHKIHHLFFLVEVQSAHTFGQVVEPEVRLAMGLEDDNIIHCNLGGEDGYDNNACVFAHVYREDGEWKTHYMADYLNAADVKDWGTYLIQYLGLSHPPAATKAGESPAMAKGDRKPLKISESARQRMLCGLSWDPLEIDVSMMEKLQNLNENIESFDLDLSCVMYNADGEFVDGVSPRPDETVDQSGKIYHTGDDTSGTGGGDDEAISVEFKDLPDYIHHIVFIAEIQSQHFFEDIFNPFFRIADGMTDEDLLAVNIKGEHNTAYIAAHLYRKDDGWIMHFVDEYVDGENVPDWTEHLKQYL